MNSRISVRRRQLIFITIFSKGKSMKASVLAVQALSVGTILATLGGCAAEETHPGVPYNAMQFASGGKVVAYSAHTMGEPI
jgi:hypothetical protein